MIADLYRRALLVLTLAVAGCTGIQSQAPLFSVMSESVEQGNVPFAIGMVSENGKITFAGAVGESSPGYEVDTATIVRLDSLTKPITAAAIMILRDDGILKLDDPVASYVEGFADVQVRKQSDGDHLGALVAPERPVTIRDLLTHTGGLAGYSSAVDALWEASSNLEFAEGIADLALRHEPGTGFQYGNAYEVLPAIVSAASKMPFDEFLATRIFSPLSMTDTFFVVPEDKRHRYSALYSKDDGGSLIVIMTPGDPETERFPSGGGGLKSTVSDYHRFALMLMNGGELDGVRVLSQDAVHRMTSPQVDRAVLGAWQEDYDWGLGLAIRTRLNDTGDPASLNSFGWNGGLGTLFFVDPDQGLIGVVFTQMHWSNEYDLRDRFKNQAYKTLN